MKEQKNLSTYALVGIAHFKEDIQTGERIAKLVIVKCKNRKLILTGYWSDAAFGFHRAAAHVFSGI